MRKLWPPFLGYAVVVQMQILDKNSIDSTPIEEEERESIDDDDDWLNLIHEEHTLPVIQKLHDQLSLD